MLKLNFMLLLSVFAAFAYGQPAFKGGSAALYNFISQKIVYPEYSKQNCISGTIKVSFTVDKSGTVRDAKVSEGLGIDLDEEAVRVIKLTSGKWVVPGNYNVATLILPIRFEANRTPCGSNNPNDMRLAIGAYKNQQRLEEAVTGYYTAKYAGKADTTHEAAIISLKKQLGYNDKYIDDVLEQANEKLQQGDNAGACHDWMFIRNIGSNKADEFLSKYCK